MSTNHKRTLLLSPILLSMLTAGSVQAQDAKNSEPQSLPLSIKTNITRADVEFNAQAEQFMETAAKDKVATQCALYSVDSAGNSHCAAYDSASKSASVTVGIQDFDV